MPGPIDLADASPVGTGRVRPRQQKSMGWIQAGVILFAFAAPSAVMAVPYALGMAGVLGGILICLIITSASVAGAMMILQVKLLHHECHTFGDLGLKVLGKPGQIWGNVIQLGNFLLFMPCALQFCALALEGIGNGIPAFNGCSCLRYCIRVFIDHAGENLQQYGNPFDGVAYQRLRDDCYYDCGILPIRERE
jgi:hypothetical protein